MCGPIGYVIFSFFLGEVEFEKDILVSTVCALPVFSADEDNSQDSMQTIHQKLKNENDIAFMNFIKRLKRVYPHYNLVVIDTKLSNTIKITHKTTLQQTAFVLLINKDSNGILLFEAVLMTFQRKFHWIYTGFNFCSSFLVHEFDKDTNSLFGILP